MNQQNALKVFSSDGLNNIKQRVSYPSDNPTIWKFVDLSTFLTILTDSCLFFSSINNLCTDDPFECALWPCQKYNGWTKDIFIDRALSLSSVLPRPDLFEEQIMQLERFGTYLAKADENKLIETVSWLELEFYRRRIICSCWHENMHESDAMWKIYSARTGVAIKSTAELLAQSIEGYMTETHSIQEIHYVMERVHYCEEPQLASVPELYVSCPWMLKRSGFEHEKEIRIFNQAPDKTPAGSGIRIKVNLLRLAEQIVLSPFNPKYVNDGIQRAVKKIVLELDGKVRPSDHMRKPIITNPFLCDKENRKSVESSCHNMDFLIKNKLLF
jgi:hypothetical protein